MLATKSSLSPYQREVILKTSAKNISSAGTNSNYAGKIGAGALDAGAAVFAACGYDVNSQSTRTMVIKNIEISNRCKPGTVVGLYPQFKNLVIEGGTAPYTYKWIALPHNDATLSNLTIPNPDVVAVGSVTGKLKFLLTVYDNSTIKKVASKVIEVSFVTSGVDLTIRDGLSDYGMEPNNMEVLDANNWDYWNSPDLWNRIAQDGGTTHQNTYYSSTTATPTNYMYARVRNIGCAASDNSLKIRIFRSKSATVQTWPTNWTEITNGTGVNIPALNPGAEATVYQSYVAPSPQSLGLGNRYLHFCMYAKITPTGITEVASVKTNTKASNNIAMRNLTMAGMWPKSQTRNSTATQFDMRGESGGTNTYTLELINDKSINKHLSGDMTQLIYFRLKLPAALWTIWDLGGRKGKWTSLDEPNKTIIFNGGVDTMRLENISLAANATYPIDVTIHSIPANYSYEIRNIEYHVRQIKAGEIVGNVNLTVSLFDTSNKDTLGYKSGLIIPTQNEIVPEHSYRIYPNPATKECNIRVAGADIQSANVRVFDMVGREVIRKENISLGRSDEYTFSTEQLVSGVYFVVIDDNLGKSQKIRLVKVE